MRRNKIIQVAVFSGLSSICTYGLVLLGMSVVLSGLESQVSRSRMMAIASQIGVISAVGVGGLVAGGGLLLQRSASEAAQQKMFPEGDVNSLLLAQLRRPDIVGPDLARVLDFLEKSPPTA